MVMDYGITAGVVVVTLASYSLIGKMITKRNGNSGGLKAHNDSATAHPDMREDMSTMGKKITKIDDRTTRMDKKLDRLLGSS